MIALQNIPNAISIGRILLMFPALWMLVSQQYGNAILFFMIAGISDVLDGFLAKRYGWESRIGGILDPLADKILLLSVFIALAWISAIPWWFVAIISIRDFSLFLGGLYYNVAVDKFIAEPSLLSKINTLLQIVLVLMVLFDLWQAVVPSVMIFSMLVLIVITATYSLSRYYLKWSKKAAELKVKSS